MKKQIQLVLKLSLCLAIILQAGMLQAQQSDQEAIKETALNYLEGWYSADTARMAKALSKDLAKRGFLVDPNSGELRIAPATYEQMLEWTGRKPNELKENPDIKLKVEIIEVGDNVAMVKTTAPHFIDFLHLGRKDGEWKIYNAIWEPPPAP